MSTFRSILLLITLKVSPPLSLLSLLFVLIVLWINFLLLISLNSLTLILSLLSRLNLSVNWLHSPWQLIWKVIYFWLFQDLWINLQAWKLLNPLLIQLFSIHQLSCFNLIWLNWLNRRSVLKGSKRIPNPFWVALNILANLLPFWIL